MTSHNELRSLLVFSGVTGFLGGALAAWLTLNTPAIAQDLAGRSPTVVSAQEFRLVDREGTPRAVLGFSSDTDPYLTMRHRNDSNTIWLGISEESGLAIRDVDGRTRLVMSLDTAGVPSLVLRDRDRNTRMIHP